MNGSIAVTDNDWFAFLSQQPGIDEEKRVLAKYNTRLLIIRE
jgi:hypothetical protein